MCRSAQILMIAVSAISLVACVAPIQPFEGTNSVRVGQGGTHENYEGVDVWTHGEPPGPYQIIGYTTVDTGEGWLGHRMLLPRVADRVRAAGGDAALLGNSYSHVASVQRAGSTLIPNNVRTVEITIVRYR